MKMSSSICQFSFSCQDEFLKEYNSLCYQTRQWLHYSTIPHSDEDQHVCMPVYDHIRDYVFPVSYALQDERVPEWKENGFRKEEFSVEDYDENWAIMDAQRDKDDCTFPGDDSDNPKSASLRYIYDLLLPWINLMVKSTQFPADEESLLSFSSEFLPLINDIHVSIIGCCLIHCMQTRSSKAFR
eukprot:gb/GECG01008424.1/.p1 GENE.gb/GECG01008424.1/~~gb/GECG01008424.1/.p1  ORF type:complete len:184 (+),score=21.42 gb/GECG01008424.1/:1-552(+)